MSSRQFRYSQSSFNSSVLAALGLTAIVSFLIWLFAQLFALQHYNIITLVSALIFFGFCSAAMIWRYMHKSIVVAVRPDGLFDARWKRQAVPWDEIKDLRLHRRENEFQLAVHLWPRDKRDDDERMDFLIDLSPLDAPIDRVLEAFQPYKEINLGVD